MQVLPYIAAIVGIALCAMVLLLLVETVAGLLPQAERAITGPCPTYVVLIPAHEEGLVIEETVRKAMSQLGPSGRLLVVADNCTDDTASKARLAGAEVIERCDESRRAKAYAISFGIRHLAVTAAPEVVVVFDADCICNPEGFGVLARTAVEFGRPAQALDVMTAAPGAGLGVRIAAFAWAFKNLVRPRGLARLGLPCQLAGTGMAFPWPLLQQVSFETSSITEDLLLGLEFAKLGHAPVLCTGAVVSSSFPQSAAGLRSQRKRWEQGHLQTIFSVGPRLLWCAAKSGNGPLLALVLDMCVPPIALLALLVIAYGVFAASLLLAGAPASACLALAALAFGSLALSVLLAWTKTGRQWVTLSELICVPAYMLRKIPMYLGFLCRRDTAWTPTHRGP
jgi:cellulose synthase/poly-beta-1,6-N-acetylglucosamine synthase-like glycosyltransferase